MRRSDARAREIGVLDEKKRSPNEGVMEQPHDVGVRARNNGRERNYEESMYLAQSSNVNLNLFMVFNSFI